MIILTTLMVKHAPVPFKKASDYPKHRLLTDKVTSRKLELSVPGHVDDLPLNEHHFLVRISGTVKKVTPRCVMCCKSVSKVPNHCCPNCTAAFVSMSVLRVNIQSITVFCSLDFLHAVYSMNDNVQL